MYRKLKRTWTHGYTNTTFAIKFKKEFPELSKLDSEELCERLIKLNMEFYYTEPTKVGILTRLSMPFALIMMLLMIVFLPINFIITGSWGYKWDRIFNWFKAVGIYF